MRFKLTLTFFIPLLILLVIMLSILSWVYSNLKSQLHYNRQQIQIQFNEINKTLDDINYSLDKRGIQ